MKTKVIIGILTVMMLTTSVFAGKKEFKEGSWYLTPQIVLYSYAPNFGASLEYAVTENIGVGGTLMFASWSEKNGYGKVSQTLITPSVDGYYHFTEVGVKKLDVFAGLSLGYSIYSYSWNGSGGSWGGTGASDLFLCPFAGARYYFNRNTAFYLKLDFPVTGNWSGIGAVLGVTFKLK
ncbi:MAG: hypothetical protein MUF15_24470 [Acidobacteria bacterium]|jgi:hypothetical protein|nr:hypothetical protein [Acidobacteriota bacterium]